ncbi:MAG TPA: DUF6320 domain-containing protein [Candidatus Sabulitectum sp.]|mgnify:CR=1 FL=1|nr:DUF6320 domain-containing protein [Candidatus Sabulitectum sp.]HPF32677.1 DUF6320 domain-containing protein [Candidatus Sabulitectum sp.]HPJ29109.1 DUF6320 domain-containing protein [Candidatus Sabulitectum sp.]HPR22975.1 DUF6320 domain-containing protein [Candidatus Sabulitectum sp.]HRW77433.1 DUF6320 domain-containing protein [Candidatus Sabulitectum sp.]
MTRICGECGIRYEDHQAECPLCVRRKPEPPSGKGSRSNVGKHLREMVTFSAFSAGLIAFITDYAYSGTLTWSRIPLLSLAYAWVTVYLVSLTWRSRYLTVAASALSTGLFLHFLSDLTSGGDGWFHAIALPMVTSAALISLLVTAINGLFNLSFMGRLLSAMAGIALFTVFIDLTVTPGVTWSLITASGTVPLIVFLAGLEKRLRRKGSSLEKYFHA